MKNFSKRYPKIADTTAVALVSGIFGTVMVFLYNLPI